MVERLDPSKNTSIDFELVQKGACVRVTDESSARLSVIDLVSALVGVNHVQARLLLLPYTGREAFDTVVDDGQDAIRNDFIDCFLDQAYKTDGVYKFRGDLVYSPVCSFSDALILVESIGCSHFRAKMHCIGCAWNDTPSTMAYALLQAWHDDWQLTMQLEAILFS